MLSLKSSFSSFGKGLSSKRSFSTLPIGEPHNYSLKSKTVTPTASVSKISELKNGIKVATISNSLNAGVSIGLFIKTGTRNESSETYGVSYFLKRLAFQSTNTRTSLRLCREFEHLGANYKVATGREYTMYSAESTADKLEDLVPLLSDAAQPALLDWEVRDQVPIIERESHDLEQDARTVVFDLLHQVAYRSKGLGIGLLPPLHNIRNIDSDILQQYVIDNYTPNNICLVATGNVDHEKLVKVANERFGDFKISNEAAPSVQTNNKNSGASKYYGGDVLLTADGDTHMALAFQGVPVTSKDAIALAALQSYLGGGNSTVDVIGGGATSKLFRSTGGENASWLKELTAFNVNYSDSGLFGVFGIATRGNANKLAGNLMKEIKSAVSSLDDAALKAAKNRYKADLFFNHETRFQLMEFAAQQTLLTGKVESLESFGNTIDSLTVDDLKNAAKKIFSSRPTLVAVGDVDDLPDTETISNSLKF